MWPTFAHPFLPTLQSHNYPRHSSEALLRIEDSGRDILVTIIDFDDIGFCGFTTEHVPVAWLLPAY